MAMIGEQMRRTPGQVKALELAGFVHLIHCGVDRRLLVSMESSVRPKKSDGASLAWLGFIELVVAAALLLAIARWLVRRAARRRQRRRIRGAHLVTKARSTSTTEVGSAILGISTIKKPRSSRGSDADEDGGAES